MQTLMDTPSFIIIGAAKSGTTSLASYLSQHPDVFIPRLKEARFLAYEGEIPAYRGFGKLGDRLMDANRSSLPTSWEAYRKLFEGMTANQVGGEASPAYLYLAGTAERIRARLPDARLVAILRNPIDRAYSSFLHMRGEDAEIGSFEEALAREDDRIAQQAGLPWRYVDMGYYGAQLARYYRVFDRSQIHICFYEELRDDPAKLLADLCTFLRIDPAFGFDVSEKRNVSGIPRNRRLYEALKQTAQHPIVRGVRSLVPTSALRAARSGLSARLLDKPPLAPHVRRQLQASFLHDVRLLENLTGKKTLWDLGSGEV